MFNNFIERDVLIDMVNKKIPFKQCLKTLNVSKRTLLKFRRLYGLSKDRVKKYFDCDCPECGKKFEYLSTKEKVVYCSRSCANKREQTQETKNKISDTLKLKGKVSNEKKYCLNCKNDITMKRKTTKFCCRSCNAKFNANTETGKEHIKNMVKKSLLTQSRRSKNEILFHDLCINQFESVENNKVIFNGWDADIIIHDFKIAVLWNGVCHYKKIYKKQSLEQIQNRDRIKSGEILKSGYIPYVIKDMGGFSKRKVNEEFEILLEFIRNNNSEILNYSIKNVVLYGLEP